MDGCADAATKERDELELALLDGWSYRTKSQLVYATLRSAIMRCELEPGSRLIIDDVSATLGVSHIPVREAINQLESERLVDVVPHAGATVALISASDVTEIFSILEGLEVIAVRVAIDRASDDGLARLASLLEPMDRAVAAQELETWAELNIGFHRQVAELTAMPMLIDMMNRVLDHWDRVRRYRNVLPGRMVEAQEEHHGIVRSLRARDHVAAAALVTRHNGGALIAYTSRLAPGEQDVHSG
jgi:DNA-binding GntR family transcriptional regulator